MFNSTVLDVPVGLIFTFLAVSLAVSAFTESIATILQWRARTLLQGVKDILNDRDLSGIALSLYNNALVSPRDRGTAKGEKDLKNLPAYIDPDDFASALIDVTGMIQEAPDKIKASIRSKVPDPQLQSLLEGVVDRTGGDLTKVRSEIAAWFDNSMDRLSGAYKRKTQLCSFLIALTLAAALNISSIGIGKALWLQPMVARTIAPNAGLSALQAVNELKSLGIPVGWSKTQLNDLKSWIGVEMVVGWLITAVATLFGAPFWFDTLERVVRLKGSGPSPAEKRSNISAAA